MTGLRSFEVQESVRAQIFLAIQARVFNFHRHTPTTIASLKDRTFSTEHL